MKQYIVDAFTDKPFSGNPAAVCVMDKWPKEDFMMKLAMENNLSETAFIVKEEQGYHLRWFTPGSEVELCIIYYRGKVVGGIYDDRFLVKPVKSAVKMMPEAGLELPYEGAKEMLLVENVENKAFLRDLLEAMYEELPAPKKKK